jgi:hypothetical protein
MKRIIYKFSFKLRLLKKIKQRLSRLKNLIFLKLKTDNLPYFTHGAKYHANEK